jgi:hypothetical protein
MRRHAHAALALIASCAALASAAPRTAAPQAPSTDIDSLMTRIGARVAEYYQRAHHVICLERSTVQPIQPNWTFDGFARTVESELRVDSAEFIRDIRRVNGRPPRERDQKDRSGCTDPNPLSPEPLAFLLPGHRDEYRFTAVHTGKEKDRAALIVDFTSAERASKPELIEDKLGHDDCFDWSGPVATKGRVWVDAETHDVLRVDRGLHGPVDVHVPSRLQRRYNFTPWIVLERDDVSLRYAEVRFTDPDEVVLLPASIEAVTVMRNTLQSTRRTDIFSDYRRFLTVGRVK